MTVNSENTSTGPYAGNGATDTFAYTFRITDESELTVYQTDADGVQVTLVLNTDYTVTGVDNDAGGNVILTTPPPTGESVYIVSAYDALQLISFTSQGAFYPDIHEDAIDRLTFLVQQINDQISKTLRVGRNDSIELIELPIAAQRANKTLSFDVSGAPVVTGDGVGDWQGDWATATDYVYRDFFRDSTNGDIWIVRTNHTSSSIATDSGAGKISKVIDVSTIDQYYLGPKSSAPTTDNDGGALSAGMLYFNTTVNKLYMRNSTSWQLLTAAAVDVTYDNSTSGLVAGNVKAAIDELKTSLDELKTFLGKNGMINGGFDIWQAGVSFVGPLSANTPVADMWFADDIDGTATVTQQAFTIGQTDVPGNPKYFLRHNMTVAPSTTGGAILRGVIEGVDSYAGETITFSIYGKVGSAESFKFKLRQYFGTGGSPSADVVTVMTESQAITTSWVRYDYTVAVPSVSGKTLGTNGDDCLIIEVQNVNATTHTLDLANAQIEKGSVATDFEILPVGATLALCHRHYRRYTVPTSTETFMSGFNNTATQFRGVMDVGKMRATPQLETTGTAGDYEVRQSGTNQALTAVPSLGSYVEGVVNIVCTSSSLTAGNGAELKAAASGAYLGFDARIL